MTENALQGRNRTLGELLAELRARLGFVNMGAASKGNEATLKSFLQEAHEYVYGELKPPARKMRSTIALQLNSKLYDWHDDANDQPIEPDAVLGIWVRQPGSEQVYKLERGISEPQRAESHIADIPRRYDILGGQMELHPMPNNTYELVIEHTQGISRFERASDRPSVPDRLLFMYALANAKAHYRHPDAQAPATTFANMLRKEKSKQKMGMRFHAASMQREESTRSGTQGGDYVISPSAPTTYNNQAGN